MSRSLRGVFITATDTGAGKTYVGCRLVTALRRSGVVVAPRKPVESGCAAGDSELAPQDGLAYWRACEGEVPLYTICPHRLAVPASPERAARLAGRRLTLEMLVEACDADSGIRIVEGAGGFYSPIAEQALNADLAHRLGLPVLLVVADRLGCVNHALLTAEAIRRRDLRLLAVVMNTMGRPADSALDNAGAINAYLGEPVLLLDPVSEERTVDALAERVLANC